MSTAVDEAQTGAPAGGRRRLSPGLRGFLLRWTVLICGVVLWELATRPLDNAFFPPPTEIVDKMRETWFSGPPAHLWLSDDAVANILPSIGRMFAGMVLATIIGVLLGVLLGRSETAYRMCDPLLQFFRAIPTPTLVPVFIVLFHIGTQMEIATIVFGTVWPILLNTTDGVRTVDPLHRETARAFRLSRWQTLWWLIIPGALPKIFAGVRVSLSISLILMVFGEMSGASNGIGYELINTQGTFDLTLMWGVIVLLGIIGYLFNLGLVRIERRVLTWHRNARRTD